MGLFGGGGGLLSPVTNVVGNTVGPLFGGQTTQDKENLRNYQAGMTAHPGDIDFRKVLGRNQELPGQLQVGMNEQSLNQMRSIAGGGASLRRPFQGLQSQERADLRGAINRIGQQTQGAIGQAQSNLAQTAGLSSGAADRIERAAQRNQLMEEQMARAASKDRQLGILQMREDVQRQTQEALPQAEMSKLSMDEFNLKNRLQQKQLEDQLQNKIFETQMKGYASEKTSQAIAGNKSKGLLGDVFSIFG